MKVSEKFFLNSISGLFFVLCPLVFLFQRYATFVLMASVVLGCAWINQKDNISFESFLLKLRPHRNQLEKIIDTYFFFYTLVSFITPYEDVWVAFKISGIFSIGWLWYKMYVNYIPFAVYEKSKSMLKAGLVVTLIVLVLNAYLPTSWESLLSKSTAKAFAPLSLTLSIAIWPLLTHLQGYKTFLSIIFASVCLLFADCDTALAGLLLGYMGYLIAKCSSAYVWNTIKVTSVVLFISLPFIFQKTLTDENIKKFNDHVPVYSYVHRLYIWQFISHKMMEHPYIGFGFASSPKDEIGGTVVEWPYHEKNGVSSPIISKQIPHHPHNAILQCWLELGFLGVLGICLILWSLLSRIQKLSTCRRQSAFAFFVSNCATVLVSISLWQTWWWATWLFLLPLLIYSRRDNEIEFS